MDIWIILCTVETIIFIISTRYLLRKKIINDQINKNLGKIIDKRDQKIINFENKIQKMNVSLKNAENATRFINELVNKPIFCHQRYIKTYQKGVGYLGSVQSIYFVYYEDDFLYTKEFLSEKSVDFDINRDVQQFRLKCRLFMDGDKLDPSLNSIIYQDGDTLKIEELNMHKFKGKGAGNFYLETLSKELLRYPQIKYIYGDLSDVDFSDKDKLVHFYNKNGFDDIVPMKKNAWGHVKKRIRVIEDDILKLDNKELTFGIEIEFQLRNGHNGVEIAKEMVLKQLSDCNEVRTFNTISEIKGWKIIRERTCDYEIISPVLSDSKQSWEQISNICSILNKYGAYTDEYCAFHVHIGTKGVLENGDQWILLRNVYRQFEPVICALSAGEFDNISNNRLKYYAITMSLADTLWCKEMTINECEKQISDGNIDLVSYFYRTRKVGMNWNCIADKSKTIEFRTFNGTINFNVIQTYLMFICNLVDKVYERKDINLPLDDTLSNRIISENYVDEIIKYLNNDEYIRYRTKLALRNCNEFMNDEVWDMLNGRGKVYID